MPQNLLVVVGAGVLPDRLMSAACRDLARALDAVLVQEGCGQPPHPLLQTLTEMSSSATEPFTLLQISGDAAVDESGHGSWLDAIAAWRCSVLMLAEPRSDGRFAGIVRASVALAHELNLSLVGLAQMGGIWSPELRRTDGLPWCGCLQGPDDDPAGLVSCLRLRWQATARAAVAGQV